MRSTAAVLAMLLVGGVWFSAAAQEPGGPLLAPPEMSPAADAVHPTLAALANAVAAPVDAGPRTSTWTGERLPRQPLDRRLAELLAAIADPAPAVAEHATPGVATLAGNVEWSALGRSDDHVRPASFATPTAGQVEAPAAVDEQPQPPAVRYLPEPIAVPPDGGNPLRSPQAMPSRTANPLR